MAIGLCCQYLASNTKRTGKIEYKNILEEKHLQYGKYLEGKVSFLDIKRTWLNNTRNLLSVLQKIHQEGFRSFRVSSNLLPLFEFVTEENKAVGSEVDLILQKIGKFAVENNIRLTCHPDQFVVLSSDKDEVIQKSIQILEYHAWMFDRMNLPQTSYYSINIHGGSKDRTDRLVESIQKLPNNVKNRLTLENCERSYNVSQLFEVYQRTGVPICFDSHHHSFNDNNLSTEDAMQLALSTWNGIKPMTHLSNTEPSLVNGSFMERRKHSDYVHYIPECQRLANNQGQLDIEFEFKMKNLAIMKALQDFDISLA